MKKITLLFATLLAMSGTILGQNLPKVLWETKLKESRNYSQDDLVVNASNSE